MSNKDKFEIKNVFCPDCGNFIAINERQNESKIKLKFFYCPECGIRINFSKYIMNNLNDFESTDKNEDKDILNKALEIIFFDEDFSQVFKNTLHFFIARMTYVMLLDLAREINTPISQMDLTLDLINIIRSRLAPILTKKPILNILRYLNDLFYKEFLSDLEMFQKKLQKKRKYRKAYFAYMRWIIKIVFKIFNQIDTEDTKEVFFNYEKRIREDLVYFFELEKNHKKKKTQAKEIESTISFKKYDVSAGEFRTVKFNKDKFKNIKDYASYLKKEIENYLDFEYNLNSTYAPTVCQLVKEGYSEFIKSFHEDGIKYSEILSEINLKQIRIQRKSSISTLANELSRIAQCLQNVLDLEYNKAPNTNQLINLGYRGFVVFIQKNNLEYAEIAELAGLEYRNWRIDLINYDDMRKIAENYGIIFPYTRKKFNKLIEERITSPSHIRFNWICPEHGLWKTSYNVLSKAKYGCPKCYRDSTYLIYEDCLKLAESKGVIFAMTRDEFEKVKAQREINNKKETRISKKLSRIPLKWRCEKHGIWITPYSILRNTAVGCPECGLETWKEKVTISFEDYYNLGKIRNDLDCAMNEKRFQNKISNTSIPPSKIPLTWKCTINLNHGTWSAPYSRIKRGHGCPLCQERVRVIGILVHPIIEYYSMKFFYLNRCKADYETQVEGNFQPDLIIRRNFNFINNIETWQSIINIPYYIKEISVDFTYTLEHTFIIDKCFKNYQTENRFLIIVLLRELDSNKKLEIQELLEKQKIEHSENIVIINFEDYLTLLKPNIFRSPEENSLINKIKKARKLGLKAINSEQEFNKLIYANKQHLKLLNKYFS